MSDFMALLFGALAVLMTGGFVVYLLKSHKASVEADKRQMELIEEQNQRIRKERQERRDRIEQRYPSSFTPPTRSFVKREEVKPTYASSPTQSMQSYDNGATDMLVNMMIMDAVTRHHNEPTISTPKYDPQVDTPTPSKSSSSWGFDDSDSRASAASSFSSSDSSSSFSSSSSDSFSSSPSSDW